MASSPHWFFWPHSFTMDTTFWQATTIPDATYVGHKVQPTQCQYTLFTLIFLVESPQTALCGDSQKSCSHTTLGKTILPPILTLIFWLCWLIVLGHHTFRMQGMWQQKVQCHSPWFIFYFCPHKKQPHDSGSHQPPHLTLIFLAMQVHATFWCHHNSGCKVCGSARCNPRQFTASLPPLIFCSAS